MRAGWPLLIERAVTERPLVVIGSGVRRSKRLLAGHLLAELSGATVHFGLGVPISPSTTS